jgi:hypothetical protein
MREAPDRQRPKLSLVSSRVAADRPNEESGAQHASSPPGIPASHAARHDVRQLPHDPNWIDTIPLPLPLESR